MKRNYIKQRLLYFWVRPYGKFYFYFKRVESRVKAEEITENLAVKERKKKLVAWLVWNLDQAWAYETRCSSERFKIVPKHIQDESWINGDGWSTEVCVCSRWLHTRAFRRTRKECNTPMCVVSLPLPRNGEQLLCKSMGSVAQRPARRTPSIRDVDLRGGSVCYTMAEVCDQICIE